MIYTKSSCKLSQNVQGRRLYLCSKSSPVTQLVPRLTLKTWQNTFLRHQAVKLPNSSMLKRPFTLASDPEGQILRVSLCYHGNMDEWKRGNKKKLKHQGIYKGRTVVLLFCFDFNFPLSTLARNFVDRLKERGTCGTSCRKLDGIFGLFRRGNWIDSCPVPCHGVVDCPR